MIHPGLNCWNVWTLGAQEFDFRIITLPWSCFLSTTVADHLGIHKLWNGQVTSPTKWKKRRKISNIFETADFLLSKDRLWSKDRLRVNTSSYTFRRASAKDCCTFGPYSCRVRFAHGSGGSISMTAHDVRLLCWILCIHTYIYSHIFIYIYIHTHIHIHIHVYTHTLLSFLLGFRIRYFWLLPKIQKKKSLASQAAPPKAKSPHRSTRKAKASRKAIGDRAFPPA